MYENRFGRFTAVDPLLASGKSDNPQTFNRYIYVGNNPVIVTDPLGLDWYNRGNQYRWFGNKPDEDGWNPVEFDMFGTFYYTGCRNADCTETDRAVLRQKGGWDWSPIPLSIGHPGFSMPNPAAWMDRIEGWKVGVPNFFKGIPNALVETPMVLGTSTSLRDLFGAPLFFEYGKYGSTTQRMAGFEAQTILTAASLLGAKTPASSGRFSPSQKITQYQEGTFSVFDWTGYPSGYARPEGPFRLLQGAEKVNARKLADSTNRAMHKSDPSLNGLQIHELQPVKFGGSPTDRTNKIFLTPTQHREFNTFWYRLQRNLEKTGQ